jgi:hypothetical protein
MSSAAHWWEPLAEAALTAATAQEQVKAATILRELVERDEGTGTALVPSMARWADHALLELSVEMTPGARVMLQFQRVDGQGAAAVGADDVPEAPAWAGSFLQARLEGDLPRQARLTEELAASPYRVGLTAAYVLLMACGLMIKGG